MTNSKKAILFALIFPILSLAALTTYKKIKFSIGHELELPIQGYDPRDLLSGHYLIYRVDYGSIKGICESNSGRQKKAGYICMSGGYFSYAKDDSCKIMIKGVCEGRRFEAGIERFYIPEFDGLKLEKALRNQQASIVISISIDGNAQVKDLLVDGESWRYLQ